MKRSVTATAEPARPRTAKTSPSSVATCTWVGSGLPASSAAAQISATVEAQSPAELRARTQARGIEQRAGPQPGALLDQRGHGGLRR